MSKTTKEVKPILKGQGPCKQCPYRKDCAPGYLGGNSVGEYFMPLIAPVDIPLHCHKTHDRENRVVCAGYVAVRVNSLKAARTPGPVMTSEQRIKENPEALEACFKWAKDFLQHHTITEPTQTNTHGSKKQIS